MKRLVFTMMFLSIVGYVPMAWSDDSIVFELSSSAFNKGEAIPEQFSCHGNNINPPLTISNVPPKTKSLALIVDDTDASEGTWIHWLVYNIRPDTIQIKENSKIGLEGLTDFSVFDYHGPCPTNRKTHHYSFRLYALKDELELNEGFVRSDLEAVMKGNILAQAELIGTYKNPEKYNE